jgi:hypothetical protein
MAWLLLALWVPATAHCQLESAFDLFVCCDHEDAVPHQDADCQTDACASVESGAYRTETPPPLGLPPAFLLAFAVAEIAAEPLLPPPSGFMATALSPPELPRGWQFSLRTALPVRAPSLAS